MGRCGWAFFYPAFPRLRIPACSCSVACVGFCVCQCACLCLPSRRLERRARPNSADFFCLAAHTFASVLFFKEREKREEGEKKERRERERERERESVCAREEEGEKKQRRESERERERARERKQRRSETCGVVRASALVECVDSAPRVEMDDIDPSLLAPPVLSRQRSERTDALDRVGLGQYRDALVRRGLKSIEGLHRFDEDELAAIGMDSRERYIFQLFADSEAGRSSVGQLGGAGNLSDASSSHELALAGLGECAIDSQGFGCAATLRLSCCGLEVCADCLRGTMAFSGDFLVCPEAQHGKCNGELAPDLVRDLFQDHCCVCSAALSGPASPGPASGALLENSGDEAIALQCGFGHQAHRRCLRNHVLQSIKVQTFPILCPGQQACKCQVLEHAVRTVLKDTSRDELASSKSRAGGDGETQLAAFYQMAYNHAIALNGFLRQCPDASCQAQLDLRQGASARLPNSRDVKCGSCRQSWCSACWQQAHPGYDCEEVRFLLHRGFPFWHYEQSRNHHLTLWPCV